MREVTVAATQFSCSWDLEANIEKAEALVRRAAAEGAQIILLQELFETPYFCIEQLEKHFELAKPLEESTACERLCALAKELGVVLPFSWFERANQAYFNSLAVIDADGSILGTYRKSHIPNGPGYQEKHYFNPGDTGFKVWKTKYAMIGVGICWDQWFPECARAMALQGAELLFYPTAIGSEPSPASPLDSRAAWQRVMQGHAVANQVPVIASNRIGTERAISDEALEITFYGSSFMADNQGEKVKEASREEEAVLVHTFDLDKIKSERAGWGLFRDRRPDLYGKLLRLDGKG